MLASTTGSPSAASIGALMYRSGASPGESNSYNHGTLSAYSIAIFVLGILQAFGIGLVITGLLGPFMATRNWAAPGETDVEALRASLPPLVGQLPEIVGIGPLLIFPAAVVFMTFLSFFIGTFLQLMWEDIPITEPL